MSLVQSTGRIALVTPRLPPSICGIGDYSSQLLQNLPCPKDIILIVREGFVDTKADNPELHIELLPSSKRDIVNLLEVNNVSALVVQYSGYGYDSHGAPIRFLQALRKWKTHNGNKKLILMAHELWSSTPKIRLSFFIQLMHKRELCRLAACADQVFTSTSGYAQWLSDYVVDTKLKTLPIGSNIIPVKNPRLSERKSGCWVLFGKQGSRIGSLNALGPRLADLNRQGYLRKLMIVGPTDGQRLDQRECRLLQRFLPSNSYVRTGPLANTQISEILLQAEYGILSQNPESYTKSTILMAYAAHGVLPVIEQSSPQSFSWMRSVDDLVAQNALTMQNDSFRDKMLSWYQLTSSWQQIALQYTRAIGLEY
jgi:hypothetical protein